MSRNLVIVAYDISDPKRLANTRKAVSSWAHGGQKSVWECYASIYEQENMGRDMFAPISAEGDRLVFLRPQTHGMRALGIGRISIDKPLIFIG